jgi:hypothetical protein
MLVFLLFSVLNKSGFRSHHILEIQLNILDEYNIIADKLVVPSFC